MKNDLWEALLDIFQKLDELFGRDRFVFKPAPTLSYAEEDDLESEKGARLPADRTLPLEELLRARSELRKELDSVRAKISAQLNERDGYLVLFAIVAHFDELVQMRFLKGDKLNWPTLQRELFQVDDAGEIFYETLDDLLIKPQTLPFVLEVYYFCLNDGFKGRYDQNPAKIIEYMERLKQRIPFKEVDVVRREEAEPMEIETPRSPAAYYVSAAVIAFVFYGVLMAAAWFWNPLLD
jgi:type IV/VI secretion system ImpK/VasF family protein